MFLLLQESSIQDQRNSQNSLTWGCVWIGALFLALNMKNDATMEHLLCYVLSILLLFPVLLNTYMCWLESQSHLNPTLGVKSTMKTIWLCKTFFLGEGISLATLSPTKRQSKSPSIDYKEYNPSHVSTFKSCVTSVCNVLITSWFIAFGAKSV